MDEATIGPNLRRIRAARQLTQQQVAEKAGLSLLGYRNIERGASVPRSDTVLAIASGLGVRMQDLLRAAPELNCVRFRSTKQLRGRDQVLTEVALWLENYTFLEELLGDHQKYRLEDLVVAQGIDPRRRASQMAKAVRDRLELGEEPVRDISGFLEDRVGVKLLTLQRATGLEGDSRESPAFFGLSVGPKDGGPAVVVNTWDRISVERWIFTAAHELGHLVLHQGAYDVRETAADKQEEVEANAFAAHFLMPSATFETEWAESRGLPFVDRVLKVKRIFRVSYATVLYRLGELYPQHGNQLWGRFRSDYQRLYGQRLGKEDEPQRLPPEAFGEAMLEGYPVALRSHELERLRPFDFRQDRLARLVRQAVEQERISLSRAAEILGVVLREMRAWSASWRGIPDGAGA